MLNPLIYTQDLLMSPATYVAGGLLYLLFWDKSKVQEGIRYIKYPNTSSINPVEQTDGKRWSTTGALKFKFKKNNNKFFIGNFRFSPKMNLCRMPRLWKKWHEKTEIYLSAVELKQTMVVFGGMGSGKTLFFINLLEQKNLYSCALVHDGGKNELVSKFFKKRRDIIFNPYDQRAKIWDLLSEDTSLQKTFFESLLKTASDKKDFFSTGAAEHMYKISLLSRQKSDLSQKERWDFFTKKIEELILNVENTKQKSEKDVVSTLKQVLEPIMIMNFRIQNGAKMFVIEEFLQKDNGAKLFVSYPPKLKSNMEAMCSAFISIYTLVHLSQPDTKNKNYLYLVDEMSSYLRIIDQGTLKDQLEKLRSKGGMFIGGLQGAEEKKELNEIIDKTIYSKIFLRTDGIATKKFCMESIGKRRYIAYKQSEGEKKNSKNFSREELEKNVVNMDDFDLLGEKHEYIAQIGDYLYRGYTPFIDTDIKTDDYIEFDGRNEFESELAEVYEKQQQAKYAKEKENSIAENAAKAAKSNDIKITMSEPEDDDEEFGADFVVED